MKDKAVFIARLLGRLLRFIAVDVPLILIGCVALAVYLPYQTRQIQKDISRSWKLPRFLKWFDTADLYGEFNRNAVTYLLFVLPKGWMYRWYWLCIRNPLNYFSYKYLSVKAEYPVKILKMTILPDKFVPPGILLDIGDSSGDVAGYRHIEYSFNGKIAYEYYRVYRYPFRPDKCFRMRLGFKLGMPDGIKRDQYQQDVLNVSFWTTFNGIP